MEDYHRGRGRLDHRGISGSSGRGEPPGIVKLMSEAMSSAFKKAGGTETHSIRADTCLVSMGNYFFKTDVLEESLHQMAADPDTRHDFWQRHYPQIARGWGVHLCV